MPRPAANAPTPQPGPSSRPKSVYSHSREEVIDPIARRHTEPLARAGKTSPRRSSSAHVAVPAVTAMSGT